MKIRKRDFTENVSKVEILLKYLSLLTTDLFLHELKMSFPCKTQ